MSTLTPNQEVAYATLRSMGFNESDSLRALRVCDYDAQRAIEFLIGGGGGTTQSLVSPIPLPDSSPAPLSQPGTSADNPLLLDAPPPLIPGTGGLADPPPQPLTSTPISSHGAAMPFRPPSPVRTETAEEAAVREASIRSAEKRQLQQALEASLSDQVATHDMVADAHAKTETDYESQLQQALAASFQSGPGGVTLSLPEQRRIADVPVGLKNVGNTCYFNALLQLYYSLKPLRRAIFQWRSPEEVSGSTKAGDGTSDIDMAALTVKFGIEVQRSFANMALSRRRFLDPSPVLKALVDDHGKPVEIGNQQDVSEFNLTFLERLEGSLASNASTTPKRHTPPVDEPGAKRTSSTMMDIDSGDVTMANASQSQKEEDEDDDIMKDIPPSIIKDLFYGLEAQVVEVPSGDGGEGKTGETLRNQEQFAQLILNVNDVGGEGSNNTNSHNAIDLYESLDAYTETSTIDYKLEDGTTTKASRSLTFDRLPSVITFQLQRVEFNRDLQQAVKVNTPLRFGKEIYLDRYTTALRDQVSTIRQQVHDYRAQRDRLREERAHYDSYNDSGSPASQVLAAAAGYFSDPITQVNLPHGFLQSDISELQNILREQVVQCDKRTGELQADIDKVQAMIDNSFSQFRNHRYRLHGVLVHSGQALSGHYWAYLYDADYDRWFKYNDIECSLVSEEEVFKTSIGGGDQTASAYCLVYVAESESEAAARVQALTARTSDSEGVTLASRAAEERGLLPETLLSEIDTETTAFETQVAEAEREASQAKSRDDYVDAIRTKLHAFKERTRPDADGTAGTSNRVHEQLMKRVKSLPEFLAFTGSRRAALFKICDHEHQCMFQRGLRDLGPAQLGELESALKRGKIFDAVLTMSDAQHAELSRRENVYVRLVSIVTTFARAVTLSTESGKLLEIAHILEQAWQLNRELPVNDSLETVLLDIIVPVVMALHRKAVGLVETSIFQSGLMYAEPCLKLLVGCVKSAPAGSDGANVFDTLPEEWITLLEKLQNTDLSPDLHEQAQTFVLWLTMQADPPFAPAEYRPTVEDVGSGLLYFHESARVAMINAIAQLDRVGEAAEIVAARTMIKSLS